MKPNVPEKIYINDFGSELSYDWHTEHCCESDIEYTRTDSFIEKAYEWLKYSTYGYLTEKWGETELDRETLAADFAKYMKGE